MTLSKKKKNSTLLTNAPGDVDHTLKKELSRLKPKNNLLKKTWIRPA